ncbi:polysaccharide deacetylase family protein [Anaerostipes sp.]|uniref:polysaccharide deacetylase family protein n=1 Tax=Anaerostipes sp. TaxID=1872530 RepID=UPI0025BF9F40|nr:polysaccharide deacetylase family protein [Anaerostipes sp.]MBS7009854.1 polysaccharide deacetylase family protein [Anaerostipes sp.]
MKKRLNKGQAAVLILMVSIIAVQGLYLARISRETKNLKESSATSAEIQKNRKILKEITTHDLGDFPFLPKRVDPEKKLIAFSFDDGPSRKNTEKILKALEKNNARATFFILGQNAKYYPDLVKKVAESGNEVAGHSWNHPLLTKLGKDGVQKQMNQMNQAIFAATGSNVGLLRPPYGSINRTVKKTVNDPLILWSIDTLDWKTLNADKTSKAILDQAKDGDIILMHDIHSPTAEAVKKVLPKLEKKGFQVCTVSELLEARNITLHPGDVVVSANDVYRYKK